jgi:hypothetical protein
VPLGGLLLNGQLKQGDERTAGWQRTFADLDELARQPAAAVLDLGHAGGREADQLREGPDRQAKTQTQLSKFSAEAGRGRAGRRVQPVRWASSRRLRVTPTGILMHLFATHRNIRRWTINRRTSFRLLQSPLGARQASRSP